MHSDSNKSNDGQRVANLDVDLEVPVDRANISTGSFIKRPRKSSSSMHFLGIQESANNDDGDEKESFPYTKAGIVGVSLLLGIFFCFDSRLFQSNENDGKVMSQTMAIAIWMAAL